MAELALCSGLESIMDGRFRMGSLNWSFLLGMVDIEDLLLSMVLELIFSREKEGFDLIFSGVVNSILRLELRLESTDDLMLRA